MLHPPAHQMAMASSSATSHFLTCGTLSLSKPNAVIHFSSISNRSAPPPPSSSKPPRLLNVQCKYRTRGEDRAARHSRIRKKVEGTTERPRLCVFRSNKHLHVQVIDDTKMHTIASCSTMQKTISDLFDYTSAPTIDVAKKVGEVIAKSCVEKGITKVAFDRGGNLYHGRVKALADAAREYGLQF